MFKKIFSKEQEYAGEMTKATEKVIPSSEVDVGGLGAFRKAAFEGDARTLRSLLDRDSSDPSVCDIEEGADTSLTAFLLASMANHLEVMDALLSYGANINATSKHGWTSLMLATKRQDEKCVEFLLSCGADVNHLSPDRWTALAEASSKGYTRIMKLLLQTGADTELRSQHDWSPLMHAAYLGNIDAVNLLLKAGATFEEVSARDETVMLLAAARGSPEIVKLLLEAGCAPESMWSKSQPVEAKGGLDGEVKTEFAENSGTTLQQQQRIERVYEVGWTPLMLACQTGNLEIVGLLLDAGANVQPKSPMFKTALEIAKENARTDIVEYLIERLGIE